MPQPDNTEVAQLSGHSSPTHRCTAHNLPCAVAQAESSNLLTQCGHTQCQLHCYCYLPPSPSLEPCSWPPSELRALLPRAVGHLGASMLQAVGVLGTCTVKAFQPLVPHAGPVFDSVPKPQDRPPTLANWQHGALSVQVLHPLPVQAAHQASIWSSTPCGCCTGSQNLAHGPLLHACELSSRQCSE